MGYIAPIPHYQYKQYQEREMKVEKHPFRFFPIQAIKPLKNKSNSGHGQVDSDNIPHLKHMMKDPAIQNPSISSKLLAEVTGKGNYFNEYV